MEMKKDKYKRIARRIMQEKCKSEKTITFLQIYRATRGKSQKS